MATAASNNPATHLRGYYLYLIPGALGFLLIVLIPQVANFVLSFTAFFICFYTFIA